MRVPAAASVSGMPMSMNDSSVTTAQIASRSACGSMKSFSNENFSCRGVRAISAFAIQ